ncbi:hypothetical protein [Streptomyces sp. 6N106]
MPDRVGKVRAKPKDEDELGGYGWGYDGSSTCRDAVASLADALAFD